MVRIPSTLLERGSLLPIMRSHRGLHSPHPLRCDQSVWSVKYSSLSEAGKYAALVRTTNRLHIPSQYTRKGPETRTAVLRQLGSIDTYQPREGPETADIFQWHQGIL